MKKLMIIAAVAVSAIASQAASVVWSASNIYQPGSTSDKIASGSGLAYLFCVQEVGSSDVLAALADTSTTLADKTTYLSSNSIASTALTSEGRINKTSAWDKAANVYTFYGIIFENDAVAEGGKFVLTAVTSEYGWDNTSDTSVALGNQKTLTQNASSWSTVAANAVPEPTSGLLLLVGAAILALKRKRA